MTASARALRPVVWSLAVVWLTLQKTGDGMFRVLDGYDRGANAVGRAAARAGRALLRVLGPLGRLLRRLAVPVLRLLRRIWDFLGVRLLLRMFRPLGRWAKRVWDRLHPLAERVQQLARELAARLEPLLHRLAAMTAVVEAAAARLGAGWRRVWAPVAHAVASLRRPGRA